MPRNLGFSDGSSLSIDRTREAGVRTLGFSDGSSITADRSPPIITDDPVGVSRPLLSKLIGGAACAYSLRDLNDKQGENTVVNVRRSGDNLEKKFKAKEITQCENWVNGKQETTLPCDIPVVQSGFSLRKIKADYTGKALRVRRRSDDIEVDVAFDGEGKVSNQSIITNVIEEGGELGDTTLTTLGEFLKEEHEVTNTNAILNNKAVSSVQGTTNEASPTLIDFTVTTLQKSNGTATTSMWLQKSENHNKPSIGKIRISLDCTHFDFENGGSLYVQPHHDHDGNGSLSYANALNITGTGHYTTEIDLATRQTTQAFRIFRNGVAVGDRVRIENLKIESLTSGASVHTWYNQAGSVNASEDSDNNQPLVAEFGNVIDGVCFDGNRFLNIPENLMNTTDATVSMVVSNINTARETHFLSNRNNTIVNSGFSISNKTGSGNNGKLFYAFIGSGGQYSTNAVIQNNSNTKQLFTLTKDSNDREMYFNSDKLTDDNASNTYTAPITNFNTSIGKEGHSSGSDANKTLTVYELIAYINDQTDTLTNNRFKIESNINNYYNLYNFNGDGFVETWYDQSGHNRHASQEEELAQPFIVQSGTLVKIGDKPAVHQDNRSSGGNKAGLGVESYNPTQNSGDLTEYSFFAHYKSDGHFGSSTQGQLFSSGGTVTSSSYGGLTIGNRDGRRMSARHRNNTELSQVLASATTSTDEAYGSIEQNMIVSFHFKDGVTLTGRDNGVETARPTSSPVSPHAKNSANQGRVRLLSSFSFKEIEPFKAPVTEIIFYDKDIRDNAEAIETNMNTYYQVY